MRSIPLSSSALDADKARSVYAFAFIWRSSFLVDDVRHFCLFDDAMISMRYAWHFAAGYGLVWNPGERAEDAAHRKQKKGRLHPGGKS